MESVSLTSAPAASKKSIHWSLWGSGMSLPQALYKGGSCLRLSFATSRRGS